MSDSPSSPSLVPLPLSPPSEDSNSPSSIPIPSNPHLDDIPVPSTAAPMEIDDQSQEEIPLPPDSSKYSPSQATDDPESFEVSSTGGAGCPSTSSTPDTLVTSSSHSVKKVLGTAQAKKRLQAFSAARSTASASSSLRSTLTKRSPLKGVTVFNPSKSKERFGGEPPAIEEIKQEETKMKELYAVNKLLSEKLKQVNNITSNLTDKPPPITAIVNPTIISSGKLEKERSEPDSSSATGSFTMQMKPPSRHLRKRSQSSSPSPGRSPRGADRRRERTERRRSRSRDRGDRDRDRRRESGGRDRDRQRRSSRSPPSRSGRRRSKEKEAKLPSPSPRKSSGGRGRSPAKNIEKEKDTVSRSKSPAKEKTEKKSKSRSRSKSIDVPTPTVVGRKSRSRSKSKSPQRKDRKKDKKERKRSRSTDRDKDKKKLDKDKERERKEKDKQAALEAERDKVRRTKMPMNWSEYFEYQYTVDNIKDLHAKLRTQGKYRKRSESGAASGSLSPEPPKSLLERTKASSIDLIGGKEYPVFLVRKTHTPPPITFGVNPLTFAGYYKTRKEILEQELPEICQAMGEILKALPTEDPSTKTKPEVAVAPKSREWFASTGPEFAPTDNAKKVVISHLYSEEEDSSPMPNKPAATAVAPPIVQKSSTSPEDSDEPEPDSMDSAPSPLLKKRYEESPTKPVTSTSTTAPRTSEKLEKRMRNDDDERRDRNLKSKEQSSKKEKKVESDDEDYLEMEVDEFPLEKDNLTVPSAPATKEKRKKEKSKDKKAKKQKKKKRKKDKKKGDEDNESPSPEPGLKESSPEPQPVRKSKESKPTQPIQSLMNLKIEKPTSSTSKSLPLIQQEPVEPEPKKAVQESKRKRKDKRGKSPTESDDSDDPEQGLNSKKELKRPKIITEELSLKLMPMPEIIPKREKSPEKEKVSKTKKELKEEKKAAKKLKKKGRRGSDDKKKKHKGKEKKRRSPSTASSSPDLDATSDSEGDSSSEESSEETPSDSDKDKKKKKRSKTDKKKPKEKKDKSKKKGRKRSKSSSSDAEEDEEKKELDKKIQAEKENDKKKKDKDDDRDKGRRGGDDKSKDRPDRSDRGGGGGGPGGASGDGRDRRDSRGDRDRGGAGNRDRHGSGHGRDDRKNAGMEKTPHKRPKRDDRDRSGRSDGRRREMFEQENLQDNFYPRWEVEMESSKQINEQRPSKQQEELSPFLKKEEEMKLTGQNISSVSNTIQFDDIIPDKKPAKVSLGVENLGKETRATLSEIDDDLLLQSVLKGDCLSTESFLVNLPSASTTISKQCNSNWSDDSEEDCKVNVTQNILQIPVVPAVRKIELGPLSSMPEVNRIEIQLEDPKLNKEKSEDLVISTTAAVSSSSGGGADTEVSKTESESSTSSSSDSDSSTSSSDSSTSSSSSDSEDEESAKKQETEEALKEIKGKELYNPFEEVMSAIAEVDESAHGTLTKVEEFNNAAAAAFKDSQGPRTPPQQGQGPDQGVLPGGDKMPRQEQEGLDSLSRDYRQEGGDRHYYRQERGSRGRDYEKRNRSPPPMDRYNRRYDDRSLDRSDRYGGSRSGSGDRDRYRRSRRHSISRSRSRSGSRSDSPRYRDRHHRHSHHSRSSRRKYRDERDHIERVPRDRKDQHEHRSRERDRDRERDRNWDELGEVPERRRDRENRDAGSEFIHEERDRDRCYLPSRHHGHGHTHGRYRGRREFQDYPEDSRYDRKELHESPPLQSNVADSTISDAELAANNQMGLLMHYPPHSQHGQHGNANGNGRHEAPFEGPPPSMFHYPMPFPPPVAPQEHEVGGMHQMGVGLDGGEVAYDCPSPPRRLSLDERLEMEMGIKLDQPKKWSGYSTAQQGPYYQGNQFYPGGSGSHANQGNLKVVPVQHHQPLQQHHQQAVNFDVSNPMTVHQQRQQCEIIQTGNFIQVRPTEIPNGSFTISASLEVTQSGEKAGSNGRRVVTIKVPVVPFAMAVVERQPIEEMQQQLQQRRPKEKKKRDKNRHAHRKHSHRRKDLTVDKEAGDATNAGDNEILDKDSIGLVKATDDDGSSKDAEAPSDKMDEDTGAEKTSPEIGDDDVFTKENEELPSPEETEKTELETEDATKAKDAISELKESCEETIPSQEQESEATTAAIVAIDVHEVKEEEKLFSVVFPLPEAGRGILVAAGFRERFIDDIPKGKKGVQFKDGVNPGYGTESSEGEEMRSPPPPSIIEMEKKKLKKLKIKAAKRKERARRKLQATKEAEAEDLAPPPPPGSPFPFCHPGILYQVCPQYAVFYAKALAEKGFDIVFEETHQIPMDAETVPLDNTIPSSIMIPLAEEAKKQKISSKSHHKNKVHHLDSHRSSRDHSSSHSGWKKHKTNSSLPSVLIELPSHDVLMEDVNKHQEALQNIQPIQSITSGLNFDFEQEEIPQQTTPIYETTVPAIANVLKGSPIPTLIRRPRSPPPAKVFPVSAETDIEGNSLLY